MTQRYELQSAQKEVKRYVSIHNGRNREALREGLTAAQSEILQKYIDCSEEYLLRMMELAFYDGFCTGGKLTMEMIL